MSAPQNSSAKGQKFAIQYLDFDITSFKSYTTPTLLNVNGTLIMFYTELKKSEFFCSEFKKMIPDSPDFRFRFADSKPFHLRTNSAEGAALINGGNNIMCIGSDSNGTQLWSIIQSSRMEEWKQGITPSFMGPDIGGRVSAYTHDTGTVYMLGTHAHGDAVWYEIMDKDGFHHDNTGIDTAYAPAICLFNGKLFMIYVEPASKRMAIAISKNGKNWTRHCTTEYYTSSGPAVVVNHGKLYIFFRKHGDNKVFFIWTEDGSSFHNEGNRSYIDFTADSDISAILVPAGICHSPGEYFSEIIVMGFNIDLEEPWPGQTKKIYRPIKWTRLAIGDVLPRVKSEPASTSKRSTAGKKAVVTKSKPKLPAKKKNTGVKKVVAKKTKATKSNVPVKSKKSKSQK